MKIYEVTGKKIRENPQQPGLQQAKVIKQTGNELTVATQAQGQPTGTEVTVDLSKNPQAIQKDPQGNVTVDPNAKPQQQGNIQLQPGQTINVANAAPGAMLPNQPNQPNQQQDQTTPENMDDGDQLEQEMFSIKDDYDPHGYDDDNRERAMMRKAFQNITQDDTYFEESNRIINLARRVANVNTANNVNKNVDILNLRKLAGL